MITVPSLDEFIDIQNIPLLLAYPTLLLSSSFILNTTDSSWDILYQIPIAIFLGSAVSVLYIYFKGSTRSSKSDGAGILIGLTGLFLSAWLLGTIRTVSLSLVLMFSPNLWYFIICFVYDLLNLLYSNNTKLDSYLIFTSYLIIYLIKGRLRGIFTNKIRSGSFVVPIVSLFVSSLGLLTYYKNLNLNMIFITIGCGLILNLTRLDSDFQLNSKSVFISSLLSIFLEFSSLHTTLTISSALEPILTILTLYVNIEDSIKVTDINEQSVIQELLSHEDTKAIFSFLLLNTSFMFVQFIYSFRSKSLGLLSDSLHMALDCTSLSLGLIAGVLAKKPTTESFPFGLARIETLAGFANGVLLIGIVAGILIEAIQRIINPVDLEKTGELLIVSILGLVVNLVGIFAFNHGHHHGHSHGGGHSHSHGSEGGESCEEEENENMKGIFLHILADTLGSAGVVLSTILIQIFKTNIFDPLSSIFIAVMIFFSAVPLIKSSGANLLLTLDDKKDDLIKDLLSQVMNTPGVVSYTTPKFWKENKLNSSSFDQGISNSVNFNNHNDGHEKEYIQSHKGDEEDHDHSHDHSHGHSHSNDNEHTHTHGHSQKNDHDDHKHRHSHNSQNYDHNHGHSHISHDDHYGDKIEFNLIGYIHIQYLDGENSTIIKKRVEKIFENESIKVAIQVENESSNCWCRAL
ncbi:hypothetical protein WICMUC_005791 [Wickerhamomyces mucosus]|uniref:Zinc transporter n=1 Tax=Wickerhamomyces mucosus TaxID=1378264 RepID=A0A9P8P3J5_9ASCO|nr:hypothetical protein WICMUC_005791 [Wickerhamomyces mucosus]